MASVSTATQRKSSYSSAQMARRRSRVLEEARKLIGEAGYDGVTMRLLAERSQVASATLYNIYGNKETLVATAVSELFEEQIERATQECGQGVDGALKRLDWIAGEILRMPEYARAMVTVYFSTTADSTVRDLLRNMSMTNYIYFLDLLRRQGQLEEWVNVDLVADEIANQEFAVVHDWAIGRVDSARLATRQKYTLLLTLGSVTCGPIARLVQTRLKELQEELAG
ncbi:MAG: TetR family transcriptional regulator [Alphaproteobacteria bacterium]|nr:TetR family transcriptional regulator [Alphaproteobacteria bacterium]